MGEFSVMGREQFSAHTKDNVVNLVLYTIEMGKQVLIFNASKNRSEATAERIATAVKKVDQQEELKKLADQILRSLSNPTKQCRRLSSLVEKGIAFHHSGLTAKQRTIIEKAFRDGLIRVISSTPTLAAGLDLPAYQVIVNDYKRYSARGFQDIPVLEFHQMAGRAGRPGWEDVGRAVINVKAEDELERVVPKYIFGEPEEIISKLAVEPTLKMYLLSLVAMDMINTKDEIRDFFSHTLYAHQYQDMDSLSRNIFRILGILKEYGFVYQDDNYYMSTQLGKKVSELYLNPDTAHYFLTYLDSFIKRFTAPNVSKFDIFSLIYFIVNTTEMQPLFRVNKKEEDDYLTRAEEVSDSLLIEFDPFEMDYTQYLNNLKTSDVFQDWIQEAPEDYITEKYGITPGELHYKLEVVDWLLYCLEELSLLKKQFYFRNYLNKLRVRFKKGVRHELLPLVNLQGVGRVRARKLFRAGFRKLADLKQAEFASISREVGESMAIKIKEQVKDDTPSPDTGLQEKPKEIKVREVTDDEVEELVSADDQFKKEREERNLNLSDFF